MNLFRIVIVIFLSLSLLSFCLIDKTWMFFDVFRQSYFNSLFFMSLSFAIVSYSYILYSLFFDQQLYTNDMLFLQILTTFGIACWAPLTYLTINFESSFSFLVISSLVLISMSSMLFAYFTFENTNDVALQIASIIFSVHSTIFDTFLWSYSLIARNLVNA